EFAGTAPQSLRVEVRLGNPFGALDMSPMPLGVGPTATDVEWLPLDGGEPLKIGQWLGFPARLTSHGFYVALGPHTWFTRHAASDDEIVFADYSDFESECHYYTPPTGWAGWSAADLLAAADSCFASLPRADPPELEARFERIWEARLEAPAAFAAICSQPSDDIPPCTLDSDCSDGE